MVEADLPRVRNRGDERGMRDSAPAVVGAGHRIGNHEECEQQQRAALQLMRPDRPALAEIFDAKRERAEIECEKRPADIAAPRAIGHQHAQHHDPGRNCDVAASIHRRPRMRLEENPFRS